MRMVVASEQMRTLLGTTERVARTSEPVMITGESGSGKEIIARAVHQFSPRSAEPFIDVNCASLPDNLIESELFGYDRGSFTGAETVKPGFFELASSGTIFLDEIGELDQRMQAKLLRVLDGQPYFRIGGTSKVPVGARVVTTTNLDVTEAVRTGRIRQDLFHRLNVFELRVPPLRERAEDIAPLAQMFLEASGLTLTDEALGMLEEYSWPGNIRQLRNILLRAALFATGGEIRATDLPRDVSHGADPAPEGSHSLEELEQQMILRVLSQTNGHQQKAADQLGISRRTLIRKLKHYRDTNKFLANYDPAEPANRDGLEEG
jgi:transcriptional regulator with PAS, ATPase and Fis domain